MSVYSGQTPKQLYRSFFRYIRHIPDPHVWSILQPRVRGLLERTLRNVPESSAQAQLRAVRARRRVEDEVRRLHMAVGCYPHAMRRVLGDCYGQSGSVRWGLINVSPTQYPHNNTDKQNIMITHSPPRSIIGRPPVPPILLPLTPAPIVPPPLKQRARSTVPETAIRKAAARSWTRQWTGLRVPLNITGTGTPKTGWEETPIIENLRILAGLPQTAETRELNLDMLPAHIRRIYPIELKLKPIEQYQPPPPRATRQNPRTWSNPHQLTRRLVKRAYSRLWESLVWVRPKRDSDQWEKCTFAELDEVPQVESEKKSRKEKKKQAVSRVGELSQGKTVDTQWL
jgi:hypothetical protein